MYSLAPIAEEGSSDNGSFGDEDENNSRLSTSGDSEATASRAMLPVPVPLFTPYPGLAVANFLTEDDGTSIIDQDEEIQPEDKESSSDAAIRESPVALSVTAWLAGVPTRVLTETSSALSSVTSHLARASSYFSVDSVVEHFTARAGEKSFQLADFCQLIDDHPSLERAKILSVECYTEPIRFGIVHRTLIFHLHRERRSDIWMRVDRRRSHNTPFLMFALRGGRTEANDVALLAGSKESLLDRCPSNLENTIKFKSPPNLGVFRFCLQIICEELVDYLLWPQNCWFMCSLLQEHLSEVGGALFQYGQHIYRHLAPRVRARVWDRVYHVVPEPPSVFDVLSQLPVSMQYYNHSVVNLQRLLDGQDLRNTAKFSVKQVENILQAIQDTHKTVTSRQTTYGPDIGATASRLLVHGLSLERRCLKDSTPSDSLRSRMLASYEKYWISPEMSDPVCLHLLDMKREQYRDNPDRDWKELACHLVRTAGHIRNGDPSTTRAYTSEAQNLLIRHASGSKSWFDSRILEGHTNPVLCVAFSPDGRRIISASMDETIHRWDVLTGESIGKPIRGHTVVSAVAFSPNGTQIVSGSFNQTVRRWDASSGEPIGAPMLGHTSFVWSVAYSPDGKLIISGSADNTIRRWDASTGEAVGKPLKGHTGSVKSVAFSPDGKRIVSGSADKTVWLWDAITGEAVGGPWKEHTRSVSTVAFSLDGRFVVSGSFDGTVRRWNALTGESVGAPLTDHAEDGNCVAVSPDGKKIVSASYDRTIRIWDATTGEPIGEPLEWHTEMVWSVAFSLDGRQIVSGSKDGTVRIWDSLEDLDGWTESG